MFSWSCREFGTPPLIWLWLMSNTNRLARLRSSGGISPLNPFLLMSTCIRLARFPNSERIN